MAKIKNLHMADAVNSNNDIRVTSTFFGLGEKATYLPTGSRITARVYDYTASDGERMASLLSKSIDEIAQFVKNGNIVANVPIGNVRVETCVTADNQLLMVQLLRFIDFDYRPMTDVQVFVGSDAEVVASLFGD
ncbi:MAG: hypothetical protein PUD61_00925 [Prevotella sp.]|nr:hypothetical protein [Prevotella sp.]